MEACTAPERIKRLRDRTVISQEVSDAFARIWGSDRNTFHHMNDDVPIDHAVLESRAKECVDALYEIESTVFAYSPGPSGIVVAHPEYWPESSPGRLRTYIRMIGH